MRKADQDGTGGKPDREGRCRRRGGKKPSAGTLQDLCAGYLELCDAQGRKPTWQGLAGHAGVTSRTLTRWLNEEEGEGTGEVLQKAADAISDRLQQRTDTMATLSMRQPVFGGFADRARESGDGQVNILVTVSGSGERETEEFGQ